MRLPSRRGRRSRSPGGAGGSGAIDPSRLLLVAGMQKSGTTLLMRLLEQTGMAASPFVSEGDDFWGNMPPFSPTEHPAGTLYQRHGGAYGHEIGLDDATPEIRATLAQRLGALPDVNAALVVNKNPFNTVRLPWLRGLFPEARIVAMVRQPVANVFSLMKKHRPHKGAGIPPEDGWWGVKPAGWRDHLGDDLVERCSWQWSAVNRKLEDDRPCVDAVIAYHELCGDPTGTLERILGRPLAEPISPLRCLDDEYQRGSRLRSKNRYYLETKALDTPENEAIEMEPLDPRTVATIEAICDQTVSLFPELVPS